MCSVCLSETLHVHINSKKIMKAIDTQQRGKYRVKVVTPIIDADAEKTNFKPIPNISSLNNFEFSAEGLRMWRAYNIGPGIQIYLIASCNLIILAKSRI